MTRDADSRFEAVVDAFAADERLAHVASAWRAERVSARAGKFGSRALKVNGKMFAMAVDGRLVVKLPKSRASALVESGDGEYWWPSRLMGIEQRESNMDANRTRTRGSTAEATSTTLSVVRAYHRGWSTKNFSEATQLLAPRLEVEVPINSYPTTESFARTLEGFGARIRQIHDTAAVRAAGFAQAT